MQNDNEHLPDELRAEAALAEDAGDAHACAVFIDAADELERCWRELEKLEGAS